MLFRLTAILTGVFTVLVGVMIGVGKTTGLAPVGLSMYSESSSPQQIFVDIQHQLNQYRQSTIPDISSQPPRKYSLTVDEESVELIFTNSQRNDRNAYYDLAIMSNGVIYEPLQSPVGYEWQVSPDGALLYVNANHDINKYVGNIVQIDLRTMQTQELIQNAYELRTCSDYDPTWCAIRVQSQNAMNDKLYLLNVRTGSVQFLSVINQLWFNWMWIPDRTMPYLHNV